MFSVFRLADWVLFRTFAATAIEALAVGEGVPWLYCEEPP